MLARVRTWGARRISLRLWTEPHHTVGALAVHGTWGRCAGVLVREMVFDSLGAASERGGRDAALGINQSVSQIILAHHDSRINHDSTHRESACAATDPAGTGSADTVRVAMTTDAQAHHAT